MPFDIFPLRNDHQAMILTCLDLFHYLHHCLLSAQFSDYALRKFNLVALDLRAHGETGGQVPKDYDQVDAAKDISKFMVRLSLRPTTYFWHSFPSALSPKFHYHAAVPGVRSPPISSHSHPAFPCLNLMSGCHSLISIFLID
jgi:hypothetical protein